MPRFGRLAVLPFTFAAFAAIAILAPRQAHAQVAPNWVLEPVDPATSAGRNPSMIIDALGRTAIAYDKGGLWFARKESGGWITRSIPGGDLLTTGPALDHAASGSIVRIAQPASTELIHIDTPSLASNALGQARVAWSHGDAYTMYAAEESGWAAEFVASSGIPSLVVDGSGGPTVVDAFSNTALLYTQPATTWQNTQALPQSSGIGAALRADGTLAVAYRDAGAHDLHFAMLSGTTWSDEVVDTVGAFGYYLRLAFDAQNIPHIAYYDAVSRQVRHAFKSGVAWVVESVFPTLIAANGEAFPSLAIDAQGAPAMSFMDSGRERLYFASRTASGWVAEPVMDSPQAIRSSLAFGTDGRALIAIGSTAAFGLQLATRVAVAAVGSASAGASGFALHVAPNPQRIGAALRIQLSLVAREPVRLDVFDLVGRRVDSREFADLPAAAANAQWAPALRSPGVYVMRAMAKSGASATARVLVVR